MKTKSLSISLTLLLSLLTNVLWAGNTITYTSSDGEVVEPYDPSDFGATIISNEYENGLGTITFDGEVTSIGDWAFEGRSSLTSIDIPSSVTSIGMYAFYDCI